MSDPMTLSTTCSVLSDEVQPRFRCAGRLLCEVAPGSATEAAAVAFIQRRFHQAYGAVPALQVPRLLVLTSRQGSLLAAVGVRQAAAEPLFLEAYTGQPIEQLLPGSPRPSRETVAEIAHLAGVEAGVSRYLFPLLTVWLQARGYQWIGFTGTDQLRNSFERQGIQTHWLATADPARLADGGQGWGRYYDHHPQAMAAAVAEGYRSLARQGVLQRVQAWNLADREARYDWIA